MSLRLLSALPLVLVSIAACAPAAAGAQDYTAPRSGTASARGASLVRVHARAGALRILGRPGISEVRVTGTARASRRGDLDGIRLVTRREGNEVQVSAEIPEQHGFLGGQRALDLVVEVPAGIPLDVTDSSGEVEVRGVASLRLDDSSGEVDVDGVAGDVWVRDSSGALRIRNVRGGVVVDEDSSGEIDVRDVARDVLVREDSSGGIRVDRIGGSFTVLHDGSGGIEVGRVAGGVRIPRH